MISIELREKSQLDLYHKLFEVAEIDKKLKATILEIGCGRGHGVNCLSKKGYDCYGVDLVESQIQRCIDSYPHLKPKFKEAFSNKTGFVANSFDFLISVEAAQHFHSFLSFAREGYRLLRNRGIIAVTTFFYPGKHCKRKINNIISNDVSGTHRAISIDKVEEFLKKAKFHNIEIKSIGEKVFNGFCKWASQSMSKINHTSRWIEAYEKKLIDYYMIKAEKNIVNE